MTDKLIKTCAGIKYMLDMVEACSEEGSKRKRMKPQKAKDLMTCAICGKRLAVGKVKQLPNGRMACPTCVEEAAP